VVRTPRRSAALGLAVPTSMPRYTCIESTLRISAPAAAATDSATSLLPDAVGPRITTDRAKLPSRHRVQKWQETRGIRERPF
jgi:hypothetical protein